MKSSISAQTALLKTVQDIQDRAEVEECLRDMLIDVELSIQLQERLQTHQQIQLLHKRIQEQEYIIAEMKITREETYQYQTKMADTLMEELLTLSIELGNLKEMKQQHEQLLVQYDEVVAKLIQIEENSQTASIEKKEAQPTASTGNDSEPVDSEPQTHESITKERDPLYEQYDEQSTVEPAQSKEGELPVNDSKVNHDEVLLMPTNSMDESCGDDEVVTLVKEIQFDEFEKDIFLKIFSYLDAIDILNTAQINVSMYSRVDSFFDVGDPSSLSDTTVEPPTSQQQHQQLSLTSATGNATESLSLNKMATSQVTSITTQPSSVANQSQSSTIVTLPNTNQATVVDLPPITSTKATATKTAPGLATKPINDTILTTPTNTSTITPSLIAIPSLQSPTTIANLPSLASPPRRHEPSKSNDSAILNRGIFSLLQPRQRPSTSNVAIASTDTNGLTAIPSPARNFLHPLTSSATSSAATINTSNSTVGGTGSGGGGAFMLNTNTTKSMSSKLSDAELNAIILMTERLKQKEAIADALSKENETLLAKLDGTEGVKQFLINKVRDMEIALSGLVQNETKVVQQIASDQDVIAFLDGRVQELEDITKSLQKDKELVQIELERIQKQSSQKVTVISDMLQFEREKLADQEREWKMTKKLLVKEIKNCRAQNTILQSERNGYREQYESLRRSIQQSNSNGISNSNHNNKYSPKNGNSNVQRDRAYAK